MQTNPGYAKRGVSPIIRLQTSSYLQKLNAPLFCQFCLAASSRSLWDSWPASSTSQKVSIGNQNLDHGSRCHEWEVRALHFQSKQHAMFNFCTEGVQNNQKCFQGSLSETSNQCSLPYPDRLGHWIGSTVINIHPYCAALTHLVDSHGIPRPWLWILSQMLKHGIQEVWCKPFSSQCSMRAAWHSHTFT